MFTISQRALKSASLSPAFVIPAVLVTISSLQMLQFFSSKRVDVDLGSSIYDFSVRDIHGKPVSMGEPRLARMDPLTHAAPNLSACGGPLALFAMPPAPG